MIMANSCVYFLEEGVMIGEITRSQIPSDFTREHVFRGCEGRPYVE